MPTTTHADAAPPLDQLLVFNDLVVDDEITSRLLTLMPERRYGALVGTVGSTERAWAVPKQGIKWGAIFTDSDLPLVSGGDLLTDSTEARPNVPHISATGRDNESDLEAALRARADDYLLKPVLTASLVPAVQRALTNAQSPIRHAEPM